MLDQFYCINSIVQPMILLILLVFWYFCIMFRDMSSLAWILKTTRSRLRKSAIRIQLSSWQISLTQISAKLSIKLYCKSMYFRSIIKNIHSNIIVAVYFTDICSKLAKGWEYLYGERELAKDGASLTTIHLSNRLCYWNMPIWYSN